MRSGFFTPIAWAVGGVLLCAQARADAASSSSDAEARVARAQAKASIGSMESASRRVQGVLQRARSRGDSAEVRCADEDLSRVDMALRAGREHASALEDAWRQKNVGAARAELTRITIAARTAGAASVDAESCIAETRPPDGTTVRLIIEAS